MKFIYSVFPILIVFIFYCGTSLHSQPAFTLEEAIKYGLDNSNSMKLQELNVRDAEYQIKEYKAIGIPQLEGGINYTHYLSTPSQPTEDFFTPAIYGILFEEGVLAPRDLGPPEVFEFSFFRKNNLSASLDFNALLFDGVFLQGLKAAKLFKELTQSREDITRMNIKENVIKAYYAVLVAERNLQIVEENLQNVEENLEETQAFYDNGFVEQLDVDRVQLSHDELKTQYENLQQLIVVSYNFLKYQMNYPLNQPIRTADDLESTMAVMMVENLKDYEEIDYNNRPEYQTLNQQIALDEADVKRLKSGYLPTLKAFASASESLQRDNLFDGSESSLISNVNVGLGLTIPIFDGNEKSSQIQRSRIRMERNKIQKEEFERSMELETLNARISLENNRKTLTNRIKSMELNEEIFRKSQIKFREGVGSSVELRQAETSLYQSQTAYINALYDLVLAKVELNLATGTIK